MAQARPQPPQLAASVCESMQPDAQHRWPGAHAAPPLHVQKTELPCLSHVSPLLQSVPPQLQMPAVHVAVTDGLEEQSPLVSQPQ